jgi:hypothetical protein
MKSKKKVPHCRVLLKYLLLSVEKNCHKMKSQKIRNSSKINKEITEKRGKIDNPETQIHDRSLSCFGTGTFIKSCGDKIVLWTQTKESCNLLYLMHIQVCMFL